MAQFNCSFVSYTLRRVVDISVILPSPTLGDISSQGITAHRAAAPYPLLYLLHGYSNGYASWLRYTLAERFAEEKNIAIVTFSAENKFYNNRPNEDLFYDFVHTELPDFLSSYFPISQRREDTYIAGLSMGGYGALLHAISSPELYCACGAFSSGISHTGVGGPANRIVTEDNIDLFVLLEECGARADRLPHLFLTCGEEDFLYDVNVELLEALRAGGCEPFWESAPGFGHEWTFWNRALERFLDWIPRSDAYVGTRRSV